MTLFSDIKNNINWKHIEVIESKLYKNIIFRKRKNLIKVVKCVCVCVVVSNEKKGLLMSHTSPFVLSSFLRRIQFHTKSLS